MEAEERSGRRGLQDMRVRRGGRVGEKERIGSREREKGGGDTGIVVEPQ